MDGLIDITRLRKLIKARFSPRGAVRRWTSKNDLSDETLASFVSGRRPPSDALLAKLGWEKQVFYRRTQPCPCYACVQAEVTANPIEGDILGNLDPRLVQMFLCETCGNKRCPHSEHHDNLCSNSNELNQIVQTTIGA